MELTVTGEAVDVTEDYVAERVQRLKRMFASEPDIRVHLDTDGGKVVAVAGYRLSTNLFCGRHLYVDDLVTADAERSKGHGKALLAWLRALAVAEDCDVFHLDSGVQRKRAHQFYLREGLELAGYHFSERLKPRD